MKVYFHPDYNSTRSDVEVTTTKATAVAQSLIDRPIGGVEIVAPSPAERTDLLDVHSEAYVDAVITGEPYDLASSAGLGWDDSFFASVSASTGGARDAALTALTTGTVAGSLSSGLHHARYESGRGFCTFNGLVVGARAARAAGACRVLILDLDAHCGGGTASLLTGLTGVEQVDVSTNNYDGYRSRPDARLTVCHGTDYLGTIERELDTITSPTSIDLVLYNAGMDPHNGSGGPAAIDAEVLACRERMVFAWAASHHVPVAWVLAGGYLWGGLTMDGLVNLHRLTITAGCCGDADERSWASSAR
jgi:acetoin utilization deacetylase AcuC-like enzyme